MARSMRSRTAWLTCEAAIAAAAAAGPITALAPRASTVGTFFTVQNGQAVPGSDCEIFALAGRVNMAAAVRLATAAGNEAWRDAIDGLEFSCVIGGQPLVSPLPAPVLFRGPESTLATTSMDTFVSGVYTVDPFPWYKGENCLVSAAQMRITTVALADVQFQLGVRWYE